MSERSGARNCRQNGRPPLPAPTSRTRAFGTTLLKKLKRGCTRQYHSINWSFSTFRSAAGHEGASKRETSNDGRDSGWIAADLRLSARLRTSAKLLRRSRENGGTIGWSAFASRRDGPSSCSQAGPRLVIYSIETTSV